MRRTLCLILALAALAPAAARAQETPAAPVVDPADVETIDGVIAALYESISGPAGPRDWDPKWSPPANCTASATWRTP